MDEVFNPITKRWFDGKKKDGATLKKYNWENKTWVDNLPEVPNRTHYVDSVDHKSYELSNHLAMGLL